MKIARSNLGFILTMFCLPGIILTGCDKVESYEKPLTPVKIWTVEQQYASVGAARYSANIQPESEVDLAFKVSGYIDMIARSKGSTVQAGDSVTKGALLARIRDTDFSARVKQARALLAEAIASQTLAESQLAEARAAQANVKVELDRAVRLFETDSLVKPEYDAVKTRFAVGEARIESGKAQLSMARARTDAAKAQIEEAENLLSNCELRAPVSGIILRRSIETGTLVTPGVPAFTMADIDSVKVVFGVPDIETPNLKLGSTLVATSEAIKGSDFRGRLKHISPSADPKTRIFDVEVSIPNPGHRLKVGMVVSLQVAGEAASKPVIAVPLSALIQLTEKDAGYAVYTIAEREGKSIAQLKRVTIGAPMGDMIAVTGGIDAGERIIVSGATLISDKEPVKIVQ